MAPKRAAEETEAVDNVEPKKQHLDKDFKEVCYLISRRM
jgi:hypothetical protein